ncbi:helix-turn-helix domain-containing protein [Streptomyces sp. NPDC001941]|uniref:helix-turn-helix domain-containing protein n=1 Tax=Streptomyces sp. NPDC001941 TaxID=3154659 RepID=UPI0033291E5F
MVGEGGELSVPYGARTPRPQAARAAAHIPALPAGPTHLENARAADGSWRTVRTPRGGAHLPAGVIGYNEFDYRTGPRRRLELPTATVTMVILFDGALHVGRLGTPGHGPTPPAHGTPVHGSPAHGSLVRGSLVHGPSLTAALGCHSGVLRGVELVVEPWLARRVFGVPVRELTQGGLPLDDLLGRDGARLAEQLADGRGPHHRIQVVADALVRRLRDAPQVDPRVLGVWHHLVATEGQARIAELARTTGWSARTLEIRFEEQIGHTPKKTARILRLRRAAALLADGSSSSGAASACGYSDQAHLSREFKAMTGLSPTRFAAARTGRTDGERPPDRIAGSATSVLMPSA